MYTSYHKSSGICRQEHCPLQADKALGLCCPEDVSVLVNDQLVMQKVFQRCSEGSSRRLHETNCEWKEPSDGTATDVITIAAVFEKFALYN